MSSFIPALSRDGDAQSNKSQDFVPISSDEEKVSIDETRPPSEVESVQDFPLKWKITALCLGLLLSGTSSLPAAEYVVIRPSQLDRRSLKTPWARSSRHSNQSLKSLVRSFTVLLLYLLNVFFRRPIRCHLVRHKSGQYNFADLGRLHIGLLWSRMVHTVSSSVFAESHCIEGVPCCVRPVSLSVL